MTDKWVLLWSKSQAAFHIEPLSAMLKTNSRAFVADRDMDYLPLWIGTQEECHASAAHLRPTLHARQEERASHA